MDKIILVLYINVSSIASDDRDHYFKLLDEVFRKYSDVIYYVFPIEEGESRVECINPKLVSGEEFEQARKVLEENEKIVKDFLMKYNGK